MSCSDCAEYRAHGATICATCDAWLGVLPVASHPGKEPCSCDQAIRTAKIAEVALCALQGIRAVLDGEDAGNDSGMALRQIATLVSLAESGVERLNREG